MGRHGAAHFYPNIELMMGLPQLGEATQVLPRSLATDAGYQAPNGAAHGLRQSSRHAPHAQYGGHVSQILGCLCCLDMGWYISMATSRLRSPSKCGYVFSMHRVHVVVIVPMHPVRFLNEVCVCSRLDGCHVCGHHGAPDLRALPKQECSLWGSRSIKKGKPMESAYMTEQS